MGSAVTPGEPWWVEPLREVGGLTLMVGLAFALVFAWALVKVARDERRQRQARAFARRNAPRVVDLTARLTPGCPMGCAEPDCPYETVEAVRRAGA